MPTSRPEPDPALADAARDIPPILTGPQVRDVLGCSRSTVSRLAREGRLRARRIGGVVRYLRGDVLSLLTQGRASQAQAKA